MKKISIDIKGPGALTNPIINMIENNNSGRTPITVSDIASYIRCRGAEFPILYGKMKVLVNEFFAGVEIHIFEDESTESMIITQEA